MAHAQTEDGRTDGEQRPLADIRFLGYIGARGLTLVGDHIWWIAIGWAAAQLGNPSLTGVVLAVTGIPRVALMLVGGAVTDLRGARPIMLITDMLAGLAALGAAAVAWTQGNTPAAWLLIVMGLVFGTVDAFYVPASSSYMASLLPKSALARGAAIRQLTTGVATATGRAAGGVLVALGGFALAALVDSVSFFLCFVIFLFVRPRYPVSDPPRTTVRQALVDGLKYVATHPTIRGLAILTLVLNLVTTPLITVGLALRGNQAGWGPEGYGLVAACIGGGMIAGGLLGTVLKPPKRAGLALSLWAAAVCVPFGVLALSSSILVSCLAAVLWSLCLGPSNAILSGLLLATTEQAMLGRVQSFVSMVANGMTPVGSALFGFLVALTSLNTVGIVCLTALAVTVIAMFLLPEIRNAELPD